MQGENIIHSTLWDSFIVRDLLLSTGSIQGGPTQTAAKQSLQEQKSVDAPRPRKKSKRFKAQAGADRRFRRLW